MSFRTAQEPGDRAIFELKEPWVERCRIPQVRVGTRVRGKDSRVNDRVKCLLVPPRSSTLGVLYRGPRHGGGPAPLGTRLPRTPNSRGLGPFGSGFPGCDPGKPTLVGPPESSQSGCKGLRSELETVSASEFTLHRPDPSLCSDDPGSRRRWDWEEILGKSWW